MWPQMCWELVVVSNKGRLVQRDTIFSKIALVYIYLNLD